MEKEPNTNTNDNKFYAKFLVILNVIIQNKNAFIELKDSSKITGKVISSDYFNLHIIPEGQSSTVNIQMNNVKLIKIVDLFGDNEFSTGNKENKIYIQIQN